MARAACIGVAALLVIALCIPVDGQTVDVAGSVFNGAKAVKGSSAAGGVLDAAVQQFASKINATVSGLRQRIQPVLKVAGGAKADLLLSLLSPLQASATHMLDSLIAVREAAEVSLTGFFGLLLDNTKELRKTLEDGNAVIDIVNTLRGAECEDAIFEPPALEPATIAGASGSLKVTTGKCSLTREADPLKLEYALKCVEPGVAFSAKVPRYTSRFVTAAKASTESCTVTRKYGVESEVVVTLLNPADFFAAAEAEAGSGGDGDKADAAGFRNSTGRLGVNTAAGWFKTLFPLAGSLKGDKQRVQFLPANILSVVEKAIKDSTVGVTFDYKPFTLKQDMIKQAANVADALSQTFEVRQQLFKVYKDDLKEWATTDKKSELLKDLDFGGNLREAMAKYNVSTLFDGMFTKTASRLMSKTKVGAAVSSLLPGGGGAEALFTEKPLRTLLSKARTGAGQPVSLKLEAGLESAVSQAIEALKKATAGGDGVWGQLLPQVPKKGSLLEKLLKNKGTRTHLADLDKLLSSFGDLGAQLGNLRQVGSSDGAAADAGAAAGIVKANSGEAGDAADAMTGDVALP